MNKAYLIVISIMFFIVACGGGKNETTQIVHIFCCRSTTTAVPKVIPSEKCYEISTINYQKTIFGIFIILFQTHETQKWGRG